MAVALLDDMEARGLVPDEQVYTEIILACGKVGVRQCHRYVVGFGVSFIATARQPPGQA